MAEAVARSEQIRERMVWKMSVDLGRVLVPPMGQHDPLDALLVYLELQTGTILDREIHEACALSHYQALASRIDAFWSAPEHRQSRS